MTELKPCPFCGGEAAVEWEIYGSDTGYTDTGFGVACTKCGVATRILFSSRDVAVKAWNRRVDDGET